MSVSRRNMILGTAAAGLATIRPASAEIQCQPYQPGVNFCRVGVPTIRVDAARPPDQQCRMWCWAACIEAIFRINGHRVRQSRIVEKVFGSPDICEPADGAQIAYAVNGDWTSDDGESFYAEAQTLLDLRMGVWIPNAGAAVAQILAQGEPLINGAVGHATVLTGMEYLADIYGNGQILALIVRDPWNPGGSGAVRRLLQPNEAYGTFLITRVLVQ
jgi:hypothetical protein